MIPVLSNEGLLKFVKKGGERNQELISLFNFAMSDRKVEEWSKEIWEVYLEYKKSGESEILCKTIIKDLETIYQAEYDIVLMVEGKKIPEKAKIVEP
jgi:hypothetical protein